MGTTRNAVAARARRPFCLVHFPLLFIPSWLPLPRLLLLLSLLLGAAVGAVGAVAAVDSIFKSQKSRRR